MNRVVNSQFADEILERVGRVKFVNGDGPTQAEFIEYLETRSVEWDFTTCF
jgi:hypothetical protein